MIPEKLVDFLHGPHVMLLGTRSAKLRPSVGRILGAKADAENDHIAIFLPDLAGPRVLHDLGDNGMVALTVCDAISHEAYQFKGTFVDARPSDDQNMAVQDIYKSKMIVHHRQMGLPDGYWGDMLYYPSTAVTFEVKDVFVQTPGPGAGEKIAFTPGA